MMIYWYYIRSFRLLGEFSLTVTAIEVFDSGSVECEQILDKPTGKLLIPSLSQIFFNIAYVHTRRREC